MSIPAGTRADIAVNDLAHLVSTVIERSGGGSPPNLSMVYLRRKPGRGLVAMYRLRPASSTRGHPPLVYLSIDEGSLDGVRIRSGDAVRTAPLEGSWPGVLRIPDAGLALQSFPTDPALPALARACDLEMGSATVAALESAAQEDRGDPALRVRAASVEPLRYKPGDRCVLRYGLELTGGNGEESRSSLIGKVYRSPDDACHVHGLLARLHADQLEQAGQVVSGTPIAGPLVPRPVGIVPEMGLTLSEDVIRPGVDVLPGSAVLGRRGAGTTTPDSRLVATAVTLARLHQSSQHPDPAAVRTPAKEAKRALGRAERLRDFAPGLGYRAQTLARTLEERLRPVPDEAVRPAHGSFKSAQLLFRGEHEVVVTDFDQFCLADPALDVGYFVAYLRPPSLWYRRSGAREWFEHCAEAFTSAYRVAAVELGADPESVEAALHRAPLYEAALLFKIANRRPNRLNSPRPLELQAMLEEIKTCLRDAP
jgi:hypothetical protein